MITRNEIIDLLTYIAADDKRTVGPPDVKVWLDAAHDGRWPSINAAYRAVIKHGNARPDTMIRPGHITQILAEVRDDASRRYRQPELPRDLRGDDAEAWLLEQRRSYREWYFAEWASGTNWPDPTPPAIGTYGT